MWRLKIFKFNLLCLQSCAVKIINSAARVYNVSYISKHFKERCLSRVNVIVCFILKKSVFMSNIC